MATAFNNDSGYAKRRQELVTLINQLRAIGAQADLDLPRVTVIGNQSAGKSSLVEAISGITVPRDAGTCTRCPIECRMFKGGDSWSCQISIRWEFNDNGSRAQEVREVLFGLKLADKKDVELMLRRAQAAVLNPNVDIQRFIDMSATQLVNLGTNHLEFSRNAVCINLRAPDLTDLAFIDLPGIVQNAEPGIIKLVEDLVYSHIAGNCIILVTLPMSDDIENQKAMQLAKQVDPSGVRTIGVLTKPDTIPAGAKMTKNLWLDVIEGRRFALKLGYYCTRQPDEDERAAHISGAAARAAELEFFANNPPWSTSTQQYRFGTQKLVAALSGQLTRIIDQSLPKLFDETERQLSLCDARLANIPQPITSEPFAFTLSLIHAFCTKIHSYVEGHLETAALVQGNRKSYAQLKKKICDTAPLFVPYEHAATHFVLLPKDLLRVDELEEACASANQITLLQVRNRIESAVTRELPNNVPYAAKISFIKEFQKEWQNVILATAATVYQALQRIVMEIIKEQFSQYQHLGPRLRVTVDNLLRDKYEAATKQIVRLLQNETTAFTQNDHYLSDAKDKYLAQYKAIRAEKSALFARSEAGGSQATPVQTPTAPPTATTQPRTHPVGPTTSQTPAAATATAPGLGLSNTNFFTSSNGPKFGLQTATPSTNTAKSPAPFSFTTSQQAPASNASGSGSAFGSGGAFGPAIGSASAFGQAIRAAAPPPSQVFGQPASSSPFSSASPAPARSATPPVPAQPSTAAPAFSQVAAPISALTAEERKREEQRALESLARLGHTNLTVADFQKLRRSDEFEEEMSLMAEVRAYFKVAYKRIIDYVPLAIDHELLYAFANDLQTHLIATLGLSAEDASARCAAYLAEDPSVVAEREELLARKKRLESVQAELRNAGL